MSNLAGKSYAMNILTPVKPLKAKVTRLMFLLQYGVPKILGKLLGLSIIHFASFMVIGRNQWPDLGQGKQKLKNDYMLFCSNFNGTWDQYIDAFCDGAPILLDLAWWSSTKCPRTIPVADFKRYISHNQIGTDYYYNATPGSAQRDIKMALKVLIALKELEKDYPNKTPEAFAQIYQKALLDVQNALGSVGAPPEASRATSIASQHRQSFVKARWG